MQNVRQHYFSQSWGGGSTVMKMMMMKMIDPHYILWPIYGSHPQTSFLHISSKKKTQRMAFEKIYEVRIEQNKRLND